MDGSRVQEVAVVAIATAVAVAAVAAAIVAARLGSGLGAGGPVVWRRGVPRKTLQQSSPQRGRLQPEGAPASPPTSFGTKR